MSYCFICLSTFASLCSHLISAEKHISMFDFNVVREGLDWIGLVFLYLKIYGIRKFYFFSCSVFLMFSGNV